MGLILSEPIKKVVEILKILAKTSVEDAKIHQKRPYKFSTLGISKHTELAAFYFGKSDAEQVGSREHFSIK